MPSKNKFVFQIFLLIVLTVGTSVFKHKRSRRSHKTVESRVILLFFHVDGRIWIRTKNNRKDPEHWWAQEPYCSITYWQKRNTNCLPETTKIDSKPAIRIMPWGLTASVLTYDPDHARPRLGFIQSVQILAEGGNDGFVLETNKKKYLYCRTNATDFNFRVAHRKGDPLQGEMLQL